MKKFIVLFLTLILLSGCTFEYNVQVTKKVISEDNVIYIDNVGYNDIEASFENLVSRYTGPTNSLGMYSSSIVNRDDLFGISYKRNYNYSDYNKSISFSSCYDAYKMIEENGKLIISTSKEFNCFDKYKELDKVIVNLTSDYYVEKSNADIVEKNKYTWYINKDEIDNPINVTIDLNKPIISSKYAWLNAFTITVLAIAIIGIIVFLVSIRSKRKNKI